MYTKLYFPCIFVLVLIIFTQVFLRRNTDRKRDEKLISTFFIFSQLKRSDTGNWNSSHNVLQKSFTSIWTHIGKVWYNMLYLQTKRLASRYSQEAVECLKGMREGDARWGRLYNCCCSIASPLWITFASIYIREGDARWGRLHNCLHVFLQFSFSFFLFTFYLYEGRRR